jgi:hypothetical protein
VTHAEYHDWLLEIGMGWLGWTYDQTLDTPMPAIEAAYKGRIAMLKAIFGGDDAPAENPPLTPDLFKRMFEK